MDYRELERLWEWQMSENGCYIIYWVKPILAAQTNSTMIMREDHPRTQGCWQIETWVCSDIMKWYMNGIQLYDKTHKMGWH